MPLMLLLMPLLIFPTRMKICGAIVEGKTALEVAIDKLKADLSRHSLEIVDQKQANENLRMDLDAIQQEKQSIADDIKEKEEMVNRLSLELARAKNDKQFVAQKVAPADQEEHALAPGPQTTRRGKNGFGKVSCPDNSGKDGMNRKLEQAEAVLQNKIGEVWDIKDSLDRSFNVVKEKTKAANEVELFPIIVNAQGAASVVPADTRATKPGFEGKVMSVNEQSNFVIVDIERSAACARETRWAFTVVLIISRASRSCRCARILRPPTSREQSAQVKVGDTVR